MSKCRYCGKELPARLMCSNCQKRVLLARKFVKVCNEFKKIINYDEILRLREERGENEEA